ncbi:MAG TPA: NAD-dependent epimerase/dehydratase family protein, partial [Chitinophagaceae bacterium]|nr:NAD-dependent epimerase/dehydratase family protein [Chitinophagaceae bacterium]
MNILVTGSSGLIGSEAVTYFDKKGHHVTGIDNNMRKFFFGEQGDTSWNLERIMASTKNFTHVNIDIRDREKLLDFFSQNRFDAIIHCAAQPSHDKARDIALVDFDVNAVGTVNLLESTRIYSPQAVFIHVSTNKVYGDSPNELPMEELETRYDYADKKDYHGINEHCRIDQTMHSLFGASKTSGDIMAQEYGRYFGMNVGVFRGGCLTGPSHSGVELHGFLNYLVKMVMTGGKYTIFGYKG